MLTPIASKRISTQPGGARLSASQARAPAGGPEAAFAGRRLERRAQLPPDEPPRSVFTSTKTSASRRRDQIDLAVRVRALRLSTHQPMPQTWRAAARSPIEPRLGRGDRGALAMSGSSRLRRRGWESQSQGGVPNRRGCEPPGGRLGRARRRPASPLDPIARIGTRRFPSGGPRPSFDRCSQRQERSRSSGVEALPVDAEVDIHRGLPAFSVVGLPDAAVRESRERVRAAIVNSGFEFPLKRITVSLAPSDLRKAGPGFDLAIAAGILVASGQLPERLLRDWVFAGELALDGRLRRVRGALAMADAARRQSFGAGSSYPRTARPRRR